MKIYTREELENRGFKPVRTDGYLALEGRNGNHVIAKEVEGTLKLYSIHSAFDSNFRNYHAENDAELNDFDNLEELMEFLENPVKQKLKSEVAFF